MNVVDFGEAMKRPGMDTRMWITPGTVMVGTDDKHPVRFKDDADDPLPHGVLVDVKLHPSGLEVPCRVLMKTSGAGAGEYHPFVDGDEVLVAVPSGDERAGCVILGKMSNALDVFPTTVAGMDVTANTVAFHRCVEPYLLESATAIVMRQATVGAALSIDPTGQVFLSSGDGAMLAMAHDACSFQLKDLTAGFQLDPAKNQATVLAGGSALVVDDQVSEFQSAGFLKVSTGGNGAAEHVTTAEALVNFVQAIGAVVTATGGAPLTGTTLGAILVGGLPAIIATASTLSLNPAAAAALVTAFTKPKTPGTPGLGCPGFLAS